MLSAVDSTSDAVSATASSPGGHGTVARDQRAVARAMSAPMAAGYNQQATVAATPEVRRATQREATTAHTLARRAARTSEPRPRCARHATSAAAIIVASMTAMKPSASGAPATDASSGGKAGCVKNGQ